MLLIFINRSEAAKRVQSKIISALYDYRMGAEGNWGNKRSGVGGWAHLWLGGQRKNRTAQQSDIRSTFPASASLRCELLRFFLIKGSERKAGSAVAVVDVGRRGLV